MNTKTLILLTIGLLIFFSCEKKDLDRRTFVTTDDITVSGTSVITQGTITNLGNPVKEYGHVWSISSEPTVEDNKTTLGSTSEPLIYNSELYDLEPNSTYNVRAYVIDDLGTFYGETKQFTTGEVSLVLDSVNILDVTTVSVLGNLVATGSRPITQHGFCWSYDSEFPTIDMDDFNELGSINTGQTFEAEISDLIPDTTYHFRAYVINDQETIYSNTIHTKIANPVVTGSIVIDNSNTVTVSGRLNALGSLSIIHHGHCWSSVDSVPTINNDTTSLGIKENTLDFNTKLTNLDTEKKYYYRTYIQTKETILYGIVKNFIIKEENLIINNPIVKNIDSVIIIGHIDLGDYAIEEFGHCWSINPNPTISSSNKTNFTSLAVSGYFTSSISKLNTNTNYYVKAYSKTGGIINYSEEKILNISQHSLTINNPIINNHSTVSIGGNLTTVYPITEHGHCWSYVNSNPDTSDSKTILGEKLQSGSFSSFLTNLSIGTTYYVRAYAIEGNIIKYSPKKTVTIQNHSVTINNINATTLSTATATAVLTTQYPVTQRGHCWSSTNTVPTISDSKTTLTGSNTGGSFSSSLTGLNIGTTYYVRAYAKVGNIIQYSPASSVKNINIQHHSVGTSCSVNPTSSTTATATGSLITQYPVAQHGHCWSSINSTPTINDSKTQLGIKNQSGSFSSPLTGLNIGTTYYVRAYASIGGVIKYSQVCIVNIPTFSVNTNNPQLISNSTSISISGNLTSSYTVEYGFCYSTSNLLPNINDSKKNLGNSTSSSFNTTISGLTSGINYYIRAYAKSGNTVIYGSVKNFIIGNYWTQKTNVGGSGRVGAVGFSIGAKGYIGTGHDGNGGYKNDFWEYDPVTNAWTQKANFGGSARGSAVGFSIGTKGYIGTGYDGSNFYRDFWEYNPQTNVWISKSQLPLYPLQSGFTIGERSSAAGFSVSAKGYIGTGMDLFNSGLMKDFRRYSPSINAWDPMTDFGGTTRQDAVGLAINGKGYIGLGNDLISSYNDFWEYDPVTNAWTQKANFGGGSRGSVVGFSLNNKGYVGTGVQKLGLSSSGPLQKDFWEYDPITNIWTQRADFGGVARSGSVGFSINGKGYIGTGWNGNTSTDFWEYTPF